MGVLYISIFYRLLKSQSTLVNQYLKTFHQDRMVEHYISTDLTQQLHLQFLIVSLKIFIL
jgi:hypothetical protein